MCSRDDVVTVRRCSICGQEYFGGLGHPGCSGFPKQASVPEPKPKLLICDGCNVRPPFEHRCHGDRAFVRGEATGKSCQCEDCSMPF
jgi:hypothetical protein